MLGALVIPRDIVRKLESTFEPPEIEVYVNEEDPLKARARRTTRSRARAPANRRLSRAFTKATA